MYKKRIADRIAAITVTPPDEQHFSYPGV